MSDDGLTGIYGCTDGNCIIKRPTGMHTNGGCQCEKTLRRLHRTEEERVLIAKVVAVLRARVERPARLSAMPKRRHEDLTSLWRNYGEACRLENEGRANDSVSVREYEGELAAAFKELLDAAEVK